jgi:hypothetical protein
MNKLRETIEQYGRWEGVGPYIDRIESYLEADFSLAIENAKALLESIGKEICEKKGKKLEASLSMNAVLKNAFSVLGYSNENLVNQISRSLANIGQELANLRNDIGPTSHGKTLEKLRERNSKVNLLTREFLIDSTLIVSVFLIRAFENTNTEMPEKENLHYADLSDFNNFLDDSFGEFEMDSYSFLASEILYSLDPNAYETEYRAFIESETNRKEEE